MVDTSQRVMDLVEAELERNPDATVDELYEKAMTVTDEIAKLSKRQFNARYPLQIKRRKGGMKKKKSKKKKSKKPKKSKKSKKPKARKKSAAKKKTKKTKKATEKPAAASGVDRDAVRDAFMQFATDLTAADARNDLVKVLAGVDKYVEKVVKAAG